MSSKKMGRITMKHKVSIIYEKSLKIPKGAIRIKISKMNRQHNGQKKKYKRTNNDQQSIRIQLKIEQREPH
jgi:peptidyl-tRNA hydrolase